MHKRLLITAVTAVFIGSICTASFAKEKQGIKHDEVIQGKVGKEFTITLESNRTTGYQWQLAFAFDKKFLSIVGIKYFTPSSKALGKGGREEWTFKALKSGSTTVHFHYVRPWEKKPPVKNKVILIVIK